MSRTSIFRIRRMREGDLARALELSSSEGWNQTLQDWKFLLDNHLNTCIVSEFEERVIGTATALNHSNQVAWIGMVLVDREFRGQGAGKMLLTSLIEMLPGIKSIKLDATPAGLPVYRKLGFIEELTIHRMTSTGSEIPAGGILGYETERINQGNIEEVIKIDRLLFGADRSCLLKKLLAGYPGRAFLIKNKSGIEGYVFGRDGKRFNYIGPLFSFSDETAKGILIRALVSVTGIPVAIDVLDNKTDFINWLESISFAKQRHFVRMYLKDNSCSGQVKNQYLISGPEFG